MCPPPPDRSLPKKDALSRRGFMAAAAVTALSATVSRARAERPGPGAPRIQLGLIGCGGRGRFLADLFQGHGGYQLRAVADYFPDRVTALGDACNVDETRRYTGLSGYQRVLESGVDAVAIASPPYFHPEQAAAAVGAGLHVYIAKPVAVDVPGCLSIEQSGATAGTKGLCFLVDFQTRAHPFYLEAVRRVHDGGIGDLLFGESSYLTGRLGVQADPGSPEARLRNWVFDQALSGDIITEQNIHTLDVASWIMNAPPIHASGTGGRKSRTDVGDCWDHFALTFVYPDQVGVTFCSKQCDGFGSPGGIRNRMFGTAGTLEAEYGGNVMIRGQGDRFYRGGRTTQIYQQGAVTNIARFHAAIRDGQSDTATVGPSVRSNLVTILGRTAAYSGEPVYWDQLLQSTDRLDGRLNGLKG